MSLPHATSHVLDRAPASLTATLRARLAWLTVAAAGWSGLAWLGLQLASASPPRAGFDLELLLVAGRRVTAGLSPYDAAALGDLVAQDLFYSYPPPLAQAFWLIGALPMPAALVLLGAGSVAGLALVARLLGGRFAPERAPLDVVLPVLAVAPLTFPFAIAILFGNLDATFPLVYGLLALAAIGGARAGAVPPALAGAALAAASIAKLHPASIVLWFALRRAPEARRVARAALATGGAIVTASLLVGGPWPWRDYLDVVRAGAAAELVDARNVGPAAQLALLAGGSETVARLAQIVVTGAAVLVTAFAARRVGDPLTSLSFAATASLVTLPVTWFHYPVALMPFAVAAALRAAGTDRARPVLGLLAAAAVIGVVAVAFPVSIWLAVACVLAAVHRSIPAEPPLAATAAAPAGRHGAPAADPRVA